MSESNGTALGRIHYRVTMADGSQLMAHVWNVDMIRWDRTAGKHGWPAYDRAPMMFATFLAWAALTRTEQTALTWEEFADKQCADVHPVDAEGAELAEDAAPDVVNPTLAVAGPG